MTKIIYLLHRKLWFSFYRFQKCICLLQFLFCIKRYKQYKLCCSCAMNVRCTILFACLIVQILGSFYLRLLYILFRGCILRLFYQNRWQCFGLDQKGHRLWLEARHCSGGLLLFWLVIFITSTLNSKPRYSKYELNTCCFHSCLSILLNCLICWYFSHMRTKLTFELIIFITMHHIMCIFISYAFEEDHNHIVVIVPVHIMHFPRRGAM